MSGLAIQSNPIQAPWPESLKPLPSTLSQKVGRVFWNIISVLIPIIGLVRLGNYLFTMAISKIVLLPAQLIPSKMLSQMKQDFNEFWSVDTNISNQNQILRTLALKHLHSNGQIDLNLANQTRNQLIAHFTPIHDTVLTPEGVEISITLLRHNESDQSTPTTIHFNGNGEYRLATSDLWPLVESVEKGVPCNYVLFDYQNVGDSKGPFPVSRNLLLNGSSVVHWVREKMKTPDDLIQFYGKSLGGAVAVETQALDAGRLTGHHINQISLSNLDKMVESIFGKGRIYRWATNTMRKRGFVFDAAAAFNKLQGPKFIVRQPHDKVIQTPASLQAAVQHDYFMELEARPGFENYSRQLHHNAPLEWHEGATDAMARFLFNMPARQIEAV